MCNFYGCHFVCSVREDGRNDAKYSPGFSATQLIKCGRVARLLSPKDFSYLHLLTFIIILDNKIFEIILLILPPGSEDGIIIDMHIYR